MDYEDDAVYLIVEKALEVSEYNESLEEECRLLKTKLNSANARNTELENIIQILKSRLDSCFKDFADSPGSPSGRNAGEISSSNEAIKNQQNPINSAHSSNDIVRSSTADKDERNIIPRPTNISTQNNQPQHETTSEFVCNPEIVSGTNDISNYFSTFYVDPQTINYEENVIVSSTPSLITMVLSSYERFDKRYLVFVTDVSSAGSKQCYFLSIDDLLELPENADLVAQLNASKSGTSDDGRDLTLFTVIGQLITRMSSAIPKSADEEGDMNTVDNTNVCDEYYDADNKQAVQVKIKSEKRGRPVKRSRAPVKKPKLVKKRKKKRNSDYEYSDDDILSSCESDSEPKKDSFKIKCRVCEIDDHKTNYFKTYQLLDHHLLSMHPFNTFPTYKRCPYGENECTRHYIQKRALINHIKTCHPDADEIILEDTPPKLRSWSCTYCGETFLSCRLFQKHMKEMHPGFAETVKIAQMPELRGHQIEKNPDDAVKSPTIIIKRNKRGMFSISRRSSESSLEDDFDPDNATIPETFSKPGPRCSKKSTPKKSSPEPNRMNIVVTEAEIHQTEAPSPDREEPSISRIAASTKPTEDHNKVISKATSTTEPTDINEFVLTSVYEISSIIEKQNAAASRPPATAEPPPVENPNEKIFTALTTAQDPNSFSYKNHLSSYSSSEYSALTSLPCLLDNCSGCFFHPKPVVATSFTLDDEYVSSCRDEILADLYAIPDNPPMATGSFTTALSSQSEYDSVQTDTSDSKKQNVENIADAKSPNLMDGHDIANIVIADGHLGQVTPDIANVPITDDDNVTKSVTSDSDHPSLSDDSSQKTNRIVGDHNNQLTTEEIPVIIEEVRTNGSDDSNQQNPVADVEQSTLKDIQINSDDSEAASTNYEITAVNEKPHSRSQPTCEDEIRTSEIIEVSSANKNDLETTQAAPVEIFMSENQHKTTNLLDEDQVLDASSLIDDPLKNETSVVGNRNEKVFDVDYRANDQPHSPIEREISITNQGLRKFNEKLLTELNLSESESDDGSVIDEIRTSEDGFENNNALSPTSTPPACQKDITVAEDQNESPTSTAEDQFSNDDPLKNETSVVENRNEKAFDVDNRANDQPHSPIEREISITNQDLCKFNEKLPTDLNVSEFKSDDGSVINEINEIRTSEDGLENNNSLSPTSTPPACQKDITVAEDQNESRKSTAEDQVSGNPLPSAITSSSDSRENPLVTNTASTDSISSTAIKKSIFDPDDNSNPTTLVCDQVLRNLESSTNTEVDDAVEKSTVASNHCEDLDSTDAPIPNTSLNLPINEIVSPPQSPDGPQQSADIVEIPEPRMSPVNVSSNSDNRDNNCVNNAPLNLSMSRANETFYDEFGLSNVCEIETLDDKESAEENTPSSVSTQLSSRNSDRSSTSIMTPILHRIFSRPGSIRCTNEIIDGVGIELEIRSSSSTQSSPRRSEDLNDQSVCFIEKEPQPNDLREKEPDVQSNEETVIESAPPSKPSYSVLDQDSQYASLVKRMLNEQSLGVCSNEIVDAIEMEISVSSSSRCSTPESCGSDISLLIDSDEKKPYSRDNSGSVNEKDSSEMDTDAAVESAPPQLSPITDTAQNDDFETDTVPAVETPPPHLSPVHMSPIKKKGFEAIVSEIKSVSSSSAIQEPVNGTSRYQEDEQHQPDQSHNSIELNYQIQENIEGNASPLITSSNRLESDSLPSSDVNEKNDNEDYIDSVTRKQLINVTVLVPRLKIDPTKPISSRYELRRKTRLSYALLNSLPSFHTKGAKLKRTFHCDICGEVFIQKRYLSNHINEEHVGAKGTFMCSICGFVAQRKYSITNHRRNRHDLLSTDFVECIICEKTNQSEIIFDCNEARNMHISQKHPHPYPYYLKCPHGEGECEWYLASLEEFREHIDIYHRNEDLSVPLKDVLPGEIPWQCSICSQVFSCGEHLIDHLERDHGHFERASVP